MVAANGGATDGRGFMGIVENYRIRYNADMLQTIGYHIVIVGYGLWLPGDQRGSWSTKWDEQLGLIDPHVLHPGDPVRQRMSEERMTHPPVRLDGMMVSIVVGAIVGCSRQSEWSVAAASIEATHSHLLITYTERNIDNTIKWIKDQTTKDIHRRTQHTGPVWCKGKWRTFIFDLDVWGSARTYIEQHNVRHGLGARPYSFLNPDFVP
ncbi:MAG: hypothetical protein K8R46_01440 [Pirellulales bacterium]|nr:hypothetical protein [Pirellulales bacterium]